RLLNTALVRRDPSQRVRPEVDRLLYEEIDAHRADPDRHDDILALLISARDADGQPLSDENLLDQIITLLLAGHETTTTGLAWACERLTRHPEAMRRLQRELEDGEDAYLDAVVNETLRVRPVIDGVWRRLTAPAVVAGYRLPARGSPGRGRPRAAARPAAAAARRRLLAGRAARGRTGRAPGAAAAGPDPPSRGRWLHPRRARRALRAAAGVPAPPMAGARPRRSRRRRRRLRRARPGSGQARRRLSRRRPGRGHAVPDQPGARPRNDEPERVDPVGRRRGAAAAGRQRADPGPALRPGRGAPDPPAHATARLRPGSTVPGPGQAGLRHADRAL